MIRRFVSVGLALVVAAGVLWSFPGVSAAVEVAPTEGRRIWCNAHFNVRHVGGATMPYFPRGYGDEGDVNWRARLRCHYDSTQWDGIPTEVESFAIAVMGRDSELTGTGSNSRVTLHTTSSGVGWITFRAEHRTDDGDNGRKDDVSGEPGDVDPAGNPLIHVVNMGFGSTELDPAKGIAGTACPPNPGFCPAPYVDEWVGSVQFSQGAPDTDPVYPPAPSWPSVWPTHTDLDHIGDTDLPPPDVSCRRSIHPSGFRWPEFRMQAVVTNPVQGLEDVGGWYVTPRAGTSSGVYDLGSTFSASWTPPPSSLKPPGGWLGVFTVRRVYPFGSTALDPSNPESTSEGQPPGWLLHSIASGHPVIGVGGSQELSDEEQAELLNGTVYEYESDESGTTMVSATTRCTVLLDPERPETGTGSDVNPGSSLPPSEPGQGGPGEPEWPDEDGGGGSGGSGGGGGECGIGGSIPVVGGVIEGVSCFLGDLFDGLLDGLLDLLQQIIDWLNDLGDFLSGLFVPDGDELHDSLQAQIDNLTEDGGPFAPIADAIDSFWGGVTGAIEEAETGTGCTGPELPLDSLPLPGVTLEPMRPLNTCSGSALAGPVGVGRVLMTVALGILTGSRCLSMLTSSIRVRTGAQGEGDT